MRALLLCTLTHRLKKMAFNPGQPVSPAGAGLILVEEGTLRICQDNGRNARQPEQILGPDSMIGRSDCLDPYYSLAAGGDSRLVVKMIDCVELDAWLKTIPEAQARLFDLRLKQQQFSLIELSGERVLL